MATHTPPGYLRKQWGFMRHPQHDPTKWSKMRNHIDEKRVSVVPGHIFGLDRSQAALRASKINLKAAGFSQQIQIEQGDFRDYYPSFHPNFILTNPPHGRRLEKENQLASLYRALGEFFKAYIHETW